MSTTSLPRTSNSAVLRQQTRTTCSRKKPEVRKYLRQVIGQQRPQRAHEPNAFNAALVEPVEAVHSVEGLKHLRKV
jgi:hypothetical protein